MLGIWSKKLLRTLGRSCMLVLALNLLICSIPRCALLLDMLQETGVLAEAPPASSCHEKEAVTPPTKGVMLRLAHACQCDLQQILQALPPVLSAAVDLHFVPQASWEITFLPFLKPWQFVPGIEPPYPKNRV